MKRELNNRQGEGSQGAYDDQTLEAMEHLMGQLSSILEATIRESWLPMGFRTRVAEEFPILRELVVEDAEDLGALRAHITHLRKVGDRYSGIARESEALGALSALERELRDLESSRV